MKILTVRFKNINTLKGEWEIDFNRSPLKEAGLFAITGPNGSGKSTIFDAISLGLYGETVRLKNSPEHILSKQASDCYATVTFAVNGDVFCASWSLNINGTQPPAPEMSLVQINGTQQVLEKNIVAVRSHITELTGLDHKRFCRSVMLAQGEFAAFLNALDYERVEILEKTVGPAIYSKIVSEIVQNAETANNKLTALKEELQNKPLMQPSEVQALKDAAEQLEDDFRETQRSLAGLNENKRQLQIVQQLKAEHDRNQTLLAEALKRKDRMQSDLIRLKKAQEAESFEKDLTHLSRQEAQAAEHVQSLSMLEKKILDLGERLHDMKKKVGPSNPKPDQDQHTAADGYENPEVEKALETLEVSLRNLTAQRASIAAEQKTVLQNRQQAQQQIVENEALIANTTSWLEKHAKDAELVTNIHVNRDILGRLQSIRRKLLEYSAQQKPAEKAAKKASALLKKTLRKLDKLRNKSEKIQARRIERETMLASLLAETSSENLDKTLTDQKELLSNYRLMLKITKTYAKLKSGDGEVLQMSLKTARQQHDDLLKQIKQEQNLLARIKNVAKFESCRKQLGTRESCPLCGSLDHPFMDRELPFGKETPAALNEQEQKVQTVQRQIQSLAEQISGLTLQHNRLLEVQEKWKRFSRITHTQWAPADRKSLTQAMRTLKKDIRLQKRRIKQVRKQTKKSEKLDKAFRKKSVKINEKQMMADNLQADLNRQQNLLAQLQQETNNIRQKEEDLTGNLSRHLEVIHEKIPKPGAEEKLLRRLENKKVDYLNYVDRQRESNERLSAIKNKAETLTSKLESLRKEAVDLDNQELRLICQIVPAKNKLKQTVEKTLQNIQKESEDFKQDLLNRSAACGFTSLKDLQNSFLSLQQCQGIEQRRQAVDSEIDRHTADLETIRTKLDKEDFKAIAAVSLNDLELKTQDLNKQKDQLARELSATVDRLEQQRIFEKKYRQKIQEIEQQENLCSTLDEEKRFFETADKAQVKMRAQEMMLERLLEHSNRHLQDISGRYYLRRHPTSELGLEIEDTQQGARRTVNTLSGGESFIVSLSMALGLSDMSGNGRKIESLFVDEGFGCLDDETLYKALSTLKDLKNNGKTIGVISHVKKVEDEISTKIRLTKMSGGISRLDVVA